MAISKREGLSFVQYESDGVTQNFPFSFTYLDRDFIFVRVGSVLTTDFTFVNSNEIRLDTAAPSGVIVTISRITEGEEKLVDFQDSGIITEKLLDTEFDQVMNLVQEAKDVANSSVFIDIDTMTGDAGFARLINVADAVDPQDAMNKRTTEAMFEDFSDEFNAKLVEIQAIEDNVETIATQVDATKTDVNNKYTEIQGIATTMTSQVAQAEAAKIAAQVAQGAAEAASTSAAGYATAASTSADEAELARDQAQAIADGLGPISTEFPAVKASVEQLEIDVSDLQVTVAGHTSAIADINTDISTLETQMADTVRLTEVQTVTNKTLSGSSIVNPTRTDVKSDTYNNLVTYATTATDGQTVFAYDIGKFYGVVGGLLKDLGGGAGGLDVYLIDDMQSYSGTSDFAKGNNAAFMGGGTLQGTLSLEEVSPISGTKSLKYVQAVGSVNDYFASPVIDLDLKQKNNTSAMTFYFEYDGNDNDGRFVVYDVTNSREIASEVSFVKVANKATRYSISFYVPDNCNQIRWGYKVLVQNTGKILLVDDVELSINPFQAKDLSNNTDWTEVNPALLVSGTWIEATTTNPTYGTVVINKMFWQRDGNNLKVRYSFRQSTAGNRGSGAYNFNIKKVFGLTIDTSKIYTNNENNTNPWAVTTANEWYSMPVGFSSMGNGAAQGPIGLLYVLNSEKLKMTISSLYTDNTSRVSVFNSVNPAFDAAYHYEMEFSVPIQGWSATTSNVLLPSDTFSSDTAPLTYASSSQYTLSTLANAPIGTYITFTYAANSNTRTQTTTRPTQTDADMNVNGMQIFTRAYNAASTAASPAVFAVQIGKGMKGTSLGLYKSAGKVTAGTVDYSTGGAGTETGITIKSYDEQTGVMCIDAGYNQRGDTTARLLQYSDATNATNGFLTINAGRTLPLLAVPTPLVAYLKDVKPSGTGGGTFTAGAWQTRTLNTIEGDSSIVSLSANQFTLPAGKYEIEASVPAYIVNKHQAKLRNITDSTDTLIGIGTYCTNSYPSTNDSVIEGTVVLTSPKVFEIQDRCEATAVTTGLGLPMSFGVNEVYTTVKIKKIG